MNRQSKESAQEDEQDFEDTEQLSLQSAADTDNVGDASVEINLDDLVAEVEAEGLSTKHFHGSVSRRRLEELLEAKRMSREMSDFDDFDFD